MKTVKWSGYYCYSLEEDEAEQYSFEMEVAFKGLNFQGEFIEAEFTDLTGDSGTVKGYTNLNYIHFIYQYPYLYDQNEQGEIVVDKSVEGHHVTYDGVYNPLKGVWEGEWEILVDEIEMDDGEFEPVYDRGYWQMRHVDRDKDKYE